MRSPQRSAAGGGGGGGGGRRRRGARRRARGPPPGGGRRRAAAVLNAIDAGAQGTPGSSGIARSSACDGGASALRLPDSSKRSQPTSAMNHNERPTTMACVGSPRPGVPDSSTLGALGVVGEAPVARRRGAVLRRRERRAVAHQAVDARREDA